MANSIIYKLFAILCWLGCALIGMLALKAIIALAKICLLLLTSINEIKASKLGEFTGQGIAVFIGFLLAFVISRFFFRKGKWFWDYSSLK